MIWVRSKSKIGRYGRVPDNLFGISFDCPECRRGRAKTYEFNSTTSFERGPTGSICFHCDACPTSFETYFADGQWCHEWKWPPIRTA